MRRGLKIILAMIIVFGVGALLIWIFVEGRKELATEQEREGPIKAQQRVATEDGESVVKLDRSTLTSSGIEIAPVKAVSYQKQLKGYGTVLELQPLVDLRDRFVAANARVEGARAKLEASHKEYERLKTLQANRNISVKLFQSAEATWRSDEANAHAEAAALNGVERTVRQQWGAVLAQWLFNDSQEFERLLQRQDVLLRITLPSGSGFSLAPQNVRVQSPQGKFLAARLLSPAPSADPRIQGMSLFYIAQGRSTELLPGMNVVAYLSSGSTTTGVIVPASAVVRWQGKAWIYVQKASDRFVRREISTEAAVEPGWFVTQKIPPDDRIVTTGAQLLLSEELRSQIHVGE
jgi:hypothetical protein